MKDEEYNYWLCSIPGIGIRKLLLLEAELGTPEQIWQAGEARLAKIKGISAKDAHNIVTSRQTFCPDGLKEKLDRLDMRCTTWFSPEYPALCRHLYDPPKRLFYRGELPGEQHCMAVVGARDCSVYGRENAKRFAAALAAAGVGIISGMARGIDGLSQKAALYAGGYSLGVLGCGVDICYPAENRELYELLCKKGGVCSEYPPGTAPRNSLFPPRNRIISGFADAVLVIEAKNRSGTLITVDMALEQGKDVYALPGRITDALSEGCNRLLQQGANFVVSAEDMIRSLTGRSNLCGTEKVVFLSDMQKALLQNLDDTPQSLETIKERMLLNDKRALSTTELMGQLVKLSLTGYVKQIGNSYFVRETFDKK